MQDALPPDGRHTAVKGESSRLVPYTLLILMLFVLQPYYVAITTKYILETKEHADFTSFWTAAQAAFRGGESPYDRGRLQTYLPEQYVFPYLYPPPSLPLFYPLSWGDRKSAELGMAIVNHGCLLFLAWFVPCGLFGWSIRREPTRVALAAICTWWSCPSVQALLHGQVNFLVVVCLVLFWHFARQERIWRPAVLLMCAVLLKTYPILLVPFLVAVGKFRLALATVGLLILWTLAALALPIPDLWHEWRTKAVPLPLLRGTPVGDWGGASYNNQSLTGVLLRAFGEVDEERTLVSRNPWCAPTLLLLSGAILAIGLWAVRRRLRQSPTQAFDGAFLLVLPTTFLVSPVAWLHHCVLFLPTVLFVTDRALFGPPSDRRWLIPAVIANLLFFFVVRDHYLRFPTVLFYWGVTCLWCAYGSDDLLPLPASSVPADRAAPAAS